MVRTEYDYAVFARHFKYVGPHQKLFLDLKDKKMKGGLGWMKKYRE